MPLNHSFSITLCNTKLIMKLIFFYVIIAIAAFALLSAILAPVAEGLKELFNETSIDASRFISHPFITFKEQIWYPCLDFLQSYKLSLTVFLLVLTYFFLRLSLILPQLPVTKVLYSKMTTGYDIGLFNSLVSTGFQNLLVSLMLSLITTIIGGGLITGAVALFVYFVNIKVYFLLPVVILLYLALTSAKDTLFSQWLPEICASSSKNIFVALKSAFKVTFAKFLKNFLCFFTLNIIWFAIITSTLVPTFGAVPILAIPACIVMRSALSLTLNFSYHEQKYFVNNGTTVYTPTKLF